MTLRCITDQWLKQVEIIINKNWYELEWNNEYELE